MTTEFDKALADVVAREISDCTGLVSVERLSAGASQETYRLVISTGGGERLLCLRRQPGGVRIPASDFHTVGSATEAMLITAARDVGVPEPEVHYVLTEADGLGEGFLMQWLPGETLGSRIARSSAFDRVRPSLARQCGEILARIHAIDVDAVGLSDRLPRESPEDLVRQTWERYKRFETPKPMVDYTARWLLERLPTRHETTLVHNDFRNGNFILDPDRGITGVLDWEFSNIGDPLRDLGWICVNSWRFGQPDLPVGGFGRYEDLIEGYASVAGAVPDPEHVRFWQVFGSFWWAVTTLYMAHHYRTGPDRTVERPAIGRRCSEGLIDCVNLIIPGPVTPLVEEPRADADMPRLDELLGSVADFLREDVVAETGGRTRFLARVAANSIGIVQRDGALGGTMRRRELLRLRSMLDSDGELDKLRWQLVGALRDGSLDLEHPELIAHLRQTVADEAAIDQPGYSGLP
ncbi:MAG: phosphotransferase family protein [Gammaproteobacteria bacterium]|nr:phosphotransferase family protein [Gammaproteobacteria bacterium]